MTTQHGFCLHKSSWAKTCILSFFFFPCVCSSSDANLYHKELSEHNSSTFTIIPIFSKSTKWPLRFVSRHFIFFTLCFVTTSAKSPSSNSGKYPWVICDFLVKRVHDTFPTDSNHSCLWLVGTVKRSLPCNNHTESQFQGCQGICTCLLEHTLERGYPYRENWNRMKSKELQ